MFKLLQARSALHGAFVLLAIVPALSAAATLQVNSLADDAVGGDGLVTLREAIAAANTDTATDLGESGNGDDSISLAGLSGTLALQSTLPAITSGIEMRGDGASVLTLSGDDGQGALKRILFVDGGALTVRGMTLADGLAVGGRGGNNNQRSGAGGGGGGFGGAIFVNSGSLRVLDVVLHGNGAVGGPGGYRGPDVFLSGGGGGGGGGLGGDGENVRESYDPNFDGGTGGSGAPLAGVGGTTALPGGEGAGGGGGRNYSDIQADSSGGAGGWGGGGGGAGTVSSSTAPGLGGAGGFGGGGGSASSGNSVPDVAGAPGGEFGGVGGNTTGDRNVSNSGGGGAGLGGAIFVRSGSVIVEQVSFIDGSAIGGIGSPYLDPNAGANGQGKGGALFLADGVQARAYRVTFEGNEAGDATGSGFVSEVLNDTDDVYGVLRDQLMFASDFE